jgi:hypothetical protein
VTLACTNIHPRSRRDQVEARLLYEDLRQHVLSHCSPQSVVDLPGALEHLATVNRSQLPVQEKLQLKRIQKVAKLPLYGCCNWRVQWIRTWRITSADVHILADAVHPPAAVLSCPQFRLGPAGGEGVARENRGGDEWAWRRLAREEEISEGKRRGRPYLRAPPASHWSLPSGGRGRGLARFWDGLALVSSSEEVRAGSFPRGRALNWSWFFCT